ncbi:MAG: hypothetical protein KIS67_02010 [Verrucomicrobiae bacterium]|nr:hypothetical protein [Verrucomicrobiae bacterium]
MSEQRSPKDPLRMFTFAGRLLLLATLVIIGGMFYWFVMFVHDKVQSGALPSGHYAVAFLLIPAVIVAGLFFGLASLILERLGVRIWRKSDDNNPHA